MLYLINVHVNKIINYYINSIAYKTSTNRKTYNQLLENFMTERRTALITGSGKNIGRSTALRLANDGFNIVVNGSTNKKACDSVAAEVRSMGVDSLVAMGDIGLKDDVDNISKLVLKKFSSVDILVNNAAIRPSSQFLNMPEEEWSRVIAVNLGAAFLLSQTFIPQMIKKKWGRIINFAGMNAIHGYNGRAHVSVSKHGVWGLTKALAKEFGPHGITTNVISPGPIKTDHDDPAMTKHIEAMQSRVPVGRLGTTNEISAVVSLLASNEGGFINGELIKVNGGAET